MPTKAAVDDASVIATRESVLALHDGRAGHRAQALGLAEALSRRLGLSVVERALELAPWATWWPAALWHRASRLPGWPEAGLRDPRTALDRLPSMRLVLGAGRRTAPVVAALGRRHGVPAVQLMAPRMPAAAFDLVVAPVHDALVAPNVVESLGALGRVTPESIAAAGRALPGTTRAAIEALAPPRLAVLYGGPSASARWDAGDEDRFVDTLARLACEGRSLVVTASRRSDPGVVGRLRRACPPDRLWLWPADPGAPSSHTDPGPNPYPGLLALTDAVLVTEDSVSMASEAAASGLPVHVFRVGWRKARIAAFHRALEAHGAARPFEGRIEAWVYPPLAEADRIAAIVAGRLLSDLDARPRARDDSDAQSRARDAGDARSQARDA